MRPKRAFRLFYIPLAAALTAFIALASAFAAPDSAGPTQKEDASAAEQKAAMKIDKIEKSSERLFWVIPNYTAVEDVGRPLPITPAQKFTIAAKDSFDPWAFPVTGFYAGVASLDNEFGKWGRGLSGYGRLYVAAFADQTVSDFMVIAVFPTLLHQDPRYFRLARGGFWHRTGYALSRVFVIRGNDGGLEVNYSEIGGNAVMAAVANTYYPSADRTLSATVTHWGSEIGLDMVSNIGKEFWPDIRHLLTGN